ncbi:MAG TPA: arsenite methyltransferase [Bacteroidales bacterium]|nr:arsenite methyltransferase [Bacteroidales bacterium]
MNPKELKHVVSKKYGEIASSRQASDGSCCSSNSCCGTDGYTIFSDDYTALKGYNPEADLHLGCGIPTEYAGIKKGDSVLDLGSGAGNDCFVARVLTGDSGWVTGLDFTDEMLNKAMENLTRTGFMNIEFIKGDIEDIPLAPDNYDVVLSNCVLNLVPDKHKAFSEIYRVLKPGGHFCISDIVISGALPDNLKEAAEMYAGCVSGAISKSYYLEIIQESGFTNINIHKEKEIIIPEDILIKHLSDKEISSYRSSGTAVLSITITGEK